MKKDPIWIRIVAWSIAALVASAVFIGLAITCGYVITTIWNDVMVPLGIKPISVTHGVELGLLLPFMTALLPIFTVSISALSAARPSTQDLSDLGLGKSEIDFLRHHASTFGPKSNQIVNVLNQNTAERAGKSPKTTGSTPF